MKTKRNKRGGERHSAGETAGEREREFLGEKRWRAKKKEEIV